ncbi:phosphotransferase family protein [Streptomyces sp. MI02-7b]|uniref:phosphotransferase family protein n=1 Tax=Streptomyces sp. MI02-7b TaxID=462941 RepID=UPI0029B8E274|nr:phosphotransferase family protein [Streptomyces sp. MI02-7b]MDX3077736.1 phosphotransferase family protein [Streptomyces sp. MI02-7b]
MTTVRTTTRDPELLCRRLDLWLNAKHPGARCRNVRVPVAVGPSSETVLFDLAVPHPAGTARQRIRPCVLRLAADPEASAVLPPSDIAAEYRAVQTVAARTRVPVPELLWLETDPEPLGAPFFVMERVAGRVPPDVMPYTYGSNWLFDATEEERARLERATVGVLAEIHSVPAEGGLREHVDAQRARYARVAEGRAPSPVIERAFARLEDVWPADPGPSVLSWGDARVGAIVYDADFAPVAVLDWQMSGAGPRELDLAWLVHRHRHFQELATASGFPGMPVFLDRDRVAGIYAELTGHTPRDPDFHTLYAALRHAVVMLDEGYRQVRFGEREMPDDPDDLILHRGSLEAMAEGR